MQTAQTLRAATLVSARSSAPVRVARPTPGTLFSCARRSHTASLLAGALLILFQLAAVGALVHSYREGPAPAAAHR